MDQQTSSQAIDRIKIFEKELMLIKSDDLRKFVFDMINILPEYFFHIPASSTGKYHPAYALGEGGLVRHVRAAVWIANELFNIDPQNWPRPEKDIVIAALILHDGMKNGNEMNKYTLTDHPLIISRKIREYIPEYANIRTEIYQMLQCIETHMGRWVMDSHTGKVMLEIPRLPLQNFVHLVDYIASRRCLEFNFNAIGG